MVEQSVGSTDYFKRDSLEHSEMALRLTGLLLKITILLTTYQIPSTTAV